MSVSRDQIITQCGKALAGALYEQAHPRDQLDNNLVCAGLLNTRTCFQVALCPMDVPALRALLAQKTKIDNDRCDNIAAANHTDDAVFVLRIEEINRRATRVVLDMADLLGADDAEVLRILEVALETAQGGASAHIWAAEQMSPKIDMPASASFDLTCETTIAGNSAAMFEFGNLMEYQSGLASVGVGTDVEIVVSFRHGHPLDRELLEAFKADHKNICVLFAAIQGWTISQKLQVLHHVMVKGLPFALKSDDIGATSCGNCILQMATDVFFASARTEDQRLFSVLMKGTSGCADGIAERIGFLMGDEIANRTHKRQQRVQLNKKELVAG